MSAEGQAKVSLILELKNRLKTGLTKAKENLNTNVRDMKGRLNELKDSHIKAFTAMRNEIPLFDRAMKMLGNPYVLVAAGILTLGTVIGKTTAKAQEFHHEFLPIKQLNLDKPVSEMNRYREEIKAAAFEVGANLTDSTRAIYDLQSATGLFGRDAIEVFKKVGNYSLATGANISEAMNSVVKAMRAFGLGVDGIDGLLLSNAKTVQMGITNFRDLARVQTEYAGAAASAGQSVDSANKLFAVFTSIAKSSDIAATMTKTAFQGLKEQADGIKKYIGVSVFDKGEMKQVDTILAEIAAKFKNLNQEQISAIITKIGGTEGLREMLGKVQTGADDLVRTFEGFDKSEFSFADAMRNAKMDAATLADIAKNRIGIVSAEIGEKFLPMWASILEKVNGTLSYVYKNFDTIWSVVKNVVITLGVAKTAMVAFNIITAANPIGGIIVLVTTLVAGITLLIKKTKGWGDQWKNIKDVMGNAIEGMVLRFQLFTNKIGLMWQKFVNFIGLGDKDKLNAKQAEVDLIKQQLEAHKMNRPELEWKIKWKKGEETETEENPFSTSSGTNQGTLQPSASPIGSDSINNITGSAKQIRNLEVNIDSFIKSMSISNENIQNMDEQTLEDYFRDMFMRVVRNLETSYQ